MTLRDGVTPLAVEDVTLRFGGITALDDVSFTVEPGSVHALIGPNGAGKSSCFNVISGLYRPTSGRVRLGEHVLTDARPHTLAALGVGRSFQNVALSPGSTVRDNVLLGRHTLTRGGFLAGGLHLHARAERRHIARVEEICAFLGVAERLDTPVGALPYGIAKRVDIARALACEPTLLLLDEPAAGLDATETAAMAVTIRELRDALGISVLLVEHDMGLVMGIADRISVLDFGRLIADGPPARVREDPDVIAAYLGGVGELMETFVQLVVNGLGKGAVYALLALGFVMIFKATEVVNFAHGSLVLVGGYLVYVLKDSVGWFVAAVAGIVGAALAGLVIERLLRAARSADHNALALLTIGVDVIITEEVVRRVGAAIPFIGDPYDAHPLQLGGVTIFRTQAIALVAGAVLITAFFLAFRFSNWGVAMRAQAENREAAALMGIRSARVTATAWLIAGALAGVAVLFMATQDFSGAGLGRGTHAIALIAFPAAILGGLDSTLGAVVGGIVVGLTEALSAQYISFEFSKSAVFLVMLVVLVVRPSGLFGTRELTRV